MEGEQERVLSQSGVSRLRFFSVVITMGPERTFPVIFVTGEEKEIRGEFAGGHDACSCSVKSFLAAILLNHSINYN